MEKETSTLTIIIDLREYNVRPKRPAQFSFSIQINDSDRNGLGRRCLNCNNDDPNCPPRGGCPSSLCCKYLVYTFRCDTCGSP